MAAHFMHDGQRVDLAEDWRIGELIRAENALDLDMDEAKTAGRTAIVVYISMARLEPWKPGSPGNRQLADTVMRMEFTELATGEDDDGDAGPPAEDPAPDENGDREKASENVDQKTTGLHPLDSLA